MNIRIDRDCAYLIKCKIFRDVDHERLQETFNEWIEDNASFSIYDIQYDSCSMPNSRVEYSIFVFYHDR